MKNIIRYIVRPFGYKHTDRASCPVVLYFVLFVWTHYNTALAASSENRYITRAAFVFTLYARSPVAYFEHFFAVPSVLFRRLYGPL